jgi:hypothetical protein
VKQARFTPIVARSSATVQPLAGVSHAHLHCHGRESTSIAAAITVSHNAQIGAPRFFAQVLFAAANEGEHFVGGRVNNVPQVLLHGLVREGGSIEIKRVLKSQLLEEIAYIVVITVEDIWIYLQDTLATQMIEFGRFYQRRAMKLSGKRECLRRNPPAYPNNRNNRSVPVFAWHGSIPLTGLESSR